MGELLKRLEIFYEKQGISAENFHCPYYFFCKEGYSDFTEAKATFVSSGYESSIPRLLFVSLDPGGKGEEFYREPKTKNRTVLSVQKHEMQRDITALPKNRHWYRTVELALNILKKFNEYHDCQINQATKYFAHINTAKCCVNNPGNKKAAYRLFENCKSFVPQEVEILNPNIIVTQGSEARQTIIEYYETTDPSNYLSNFSLPKELRILHIDNHPVLWIHTFHPSNYGKFNRINYMRGDQYDRYASIAFEFVNNVWYKYKETQSGDRRRLTTMRPANVFKRFAKIVKNVVGKPDKRDTTVNSKNVFERFAKIVEKIIGKLDRFEPSRPVPWLCKNIFRKDDLQWCGFQGVFSKQENALVFGLNLEFTPAWRRAYPRLTKAEDELTVLLSPLKNMKWIWQGCPRRIMQNPWIRPLPQDKMWASEIDVHRWLKDLEDILNKKIIDTETNSPMRPQMQIMRLIGTSDQISDEDLIRHNIHQTMADLQPIVELFR